MDKGRKGGGAAGEAKEEERRSDGRRRKRSGRKGRSINRRGTKRIGEGGGKGGEGLSLSRDDIVTSGAVFLRLPRAFSATVDYVESAEVPVHMHKIESFPIKVLNCCKIHFRVSELQSFKVSNFQSFEFSKFSKVQNVKCSEVQSLKVSKFQCFLML